MKIAASLLLAGVTAAPPGGPAPGTLETYRDWTIGCDNGGRCEAVSLIPDGGSFEQAVILSVTRDAGAAAPPTVSIRARTSIKGSVSILVDGRAMATGRGQGDMVTFAGPQGAALAIAMARGNSVEVRQGGTIIGKPSLSGSAAALRYMDARQGRAGTVTALIATGPLGISAVKRAPLLPVVRRAMIPAAGTPSPLWREELGRAINLSGCRDETVDGRDPALHPLSKTQMLVLVPCGAGAYNMSSVPLIATGQAGRRTFTLARFDLRPGWGEDTKVPMLVNAGWDAAKSALSSYAKGRGIGDCGGSQTYVWDGTSFRLTEASAMGECRGAWQWITTWRATIVG